MLFHLVYFSKASEPMTEDRLAALLESSRAYNASNGITGMLLYKDDCFIQLLEGHEEDVQRVFEAIKRDSRHYSVELLWSRYVQHRDFPDWTMGFQNINRLDPVTLDGFTPFLDRDFRYEHFLDNSTDVHAMLQVFRKNPQLLA